MPVETAVRISKDLLAKLQPHADRRAMSPNALVRLIVETIVEERLIDAVLDDQDVAPSDSKAQRRLGEAAG